MTADRDPLLGQVVAGRYRVERRIGRGGMGSIYEVAHTKLGRSFALKTLSWELANDPEVLARFQREADIVAKLRHPHIVEIVDWDHLEDGTPCLIMEYLRGEDLGQRIRRAAPLPWSVIARFGDHVLSALAVAHRAGIVHRDLKPQNIFLALDDSGEERAKLLDFGVSKIRDSKSFATTDARLIGTPAYMSPEQADGSHADVDHATDVWAMGAILHEMATGRLAFEAVNMPAILYRICHKTADDVRVLRPDAPTAFAELVGAALDRDPARRIREVDELRAGLRAALTGLPDVEFEEPMRAPAGRPPPASTDPALGTGPTLAVTPATASTISASSGQSIPRASVPTLSPPAARGRGVVVGIGAVVVIAGAITAFVLTRRGDDAPAPVAAVVHDAAPRAADAAAVALVQDAAVAEMVTLRISSTPADALVYQQPQNTLAGRTPLTIKVRRGSEAIVLSVERGGFVPVRVELPTDADVDRLVELEPRPSGTRDKKPVKPKRKKGDPVDPFEDNP